jgi:hypothetical protein
MALGRLIECNETLDEQVHTSPFDKVLVLAESLITEIVGDYVPEELVPRHGPGAVSEGISEPWLKYAFQMHDPDDIDDEIFYPPSVLLAGHNHDSHTLASIHRLRAEEEVPKLSQSRLCLVPKNSKGPRVISMEATRRMWCQLGIDRILRDRISRSSLVGRGISLKDQSVNASLALAGSLSGRWATIDLSSASDCVSLKLIAAIWPVTWVRAFERYRSRTQLHPDGSVHVLNMIAPMGNGFCFTVETITFWAIAAASILCSMEEAYTSEDDVRWACHHTYAYGDDIIVPERFAGEVMSSLERYGFRINRDKSYWAGPFRESCGTDAFLGVNITPLKIKAIPQGPQKKLGSVDAHFIQSWSEQAKAWRILLPSVSAYMKRCVYDCLGWVPRYPMGWEGCIGEPSADLSRPQAFRVSPDLPHRRFKRPMVGTDGIVLLVGRPPSSGRFVKVVRVINPSIDAPTNAFPDEYAYTRWHEKCCARSVEPEIAFDARRFTLKRKERLSIRREWLA